MPKVSVVIPTYNRRDRIKRSVDSVLAQTFDDFELIIVDDASQDDTVAVLETIEDPRIRIVRHETNKGAGAARNTGFREAATDWVAYQDSDDEWLPTKLERQVALLDAAAPGTVACYCGMLVLGDAETLLADPTRVKYLPFFRDPDHVAGRISDDLLNHRTRISTQTLVCRRDVLFAAGGFDESMKALEDWDVSIRIAERGPIVFEPEPLVLQRFSANSLTRSNRNRVEAQEQVFAKYESQLRDSPADYALHCRIIGGGHRQNGDFGKARDWLMRAINAEPANVRHYASFAATLLSAVRRRLVPA